MNKERKRLPLTGGSSLLVIFSVLCLTVFSMLSLSTVKADKRIADASVQAVEEYYAADSEAERILGLLRAGQVPEGVEQEGSLYAYLCPVSETQALSVVVHINKEEYKIQQWKVVTTTEWSPQEYLDLWIPEREE